MLRPLEGLLVVSLEQAVAAPFCTMRLVDAGARVIKLERPDGDFGRGYDDVAKGQSSYFVWLNRGKESVVLDLGLRQDRALFEALLESADVFVQNLKPGALDRLGYSIETLRRRNPRLIACSISGYGETGPMAHRKAYDLLVQAESGLASITGGPSEAARVGFSIVDIATGAVAVQAILEALYGRAVSGSGADIRLSMFDTIVEWMAVPFLHAAHGRPPRRIGLAHPSIAPYGVFRSQDGKSVLISIQNEREWAVLCNQVLADPGFMTDPRFSSNVARVQNRADTDARVAAGFSALDASDLVKRLAEADIAFAFVNEISDLLGHSQLHTVLVETPNGPVEMPAPAPRWGIGDRTLGPVPGLGAHTNAVRHEFGGSREARSDEPIDPSTARSSRGGTEAHPVSS
jgi:crotonobetainyl-CoA:carnitine CoA-transferase CaiB-like acyl-CoA transferase